MESKKIKRKGHDPDVKSRKRRVIRNYDAALWTVPMCREWSGLAHPYLLRLIHAGEIEAFPLGPTRDDSRPNGTQVHRSCAKFMVLAGPFKKFVENLGVRGKLLKAAGES